MVRTYSCPARGPVVSKSDVRATMDELYAAYAARSFERMAPLIDENIDWIIYAPVMVFPYAGARRGRDAVLEVLAAISEAFAMESYQREIVVVEGERVAVMADVAFKQKATGRILRFRVANFMRFQDGRLIEFREFTNTFDVVEQALGRELPV